MYSGFGWKQGANDEDGVAIDFIYIMKDMQSVKRPKRVISGA